MGLQDASAKCTWCLSAVSCAVHSALLLLALGAAAGGLIRAAGVVVVGAAGFAAIDSWDRWMISVSSST